eukprot:15458960-Heterocapsa_arctica.AAC.1
MGDLEVTQKLRAIRLPADLAASVVGGGLRHLVTPVEYCTGVGVTMPHEPLSLVNLPAGDPHQVHEVRRQPGHGAMGLGSMLAENNGVGSRLQGIIFKPEVLLLAWAFAQQMSSYKAPLGIVICMALRLVLSSEVADEICKAIQDKRVQLPCRELVRQVAKRINMIDLLWQRELLLDQEF